MAFNIKQLAVKDTAILHLVDPTTSEPLYADDKKTLPLTIEVCGKASKESRSALAALSRKHVARKGKEASFEDNVSDNNKYLAQLSKEASNFDMGDGVSIDTFEKFVELYNTDSLYWIRSQVSDFLGDESSFLSK